ncbi:MAG TPA: hypothetical protein VFS21_06045 [Roseiflexaceae bacterium]|nr:hypothetical protein [Roseiflexaceae bacterium]
MNEIVGLRLKVRGVERDVRVFGTYSSGHIDTLLRGKTPPAMFWRRPVDRSERGRAAMHAMPLLCDNDPQPMVVEDWDTPSDGTPLGLREALDWAYRQEEAATVQAAQPVCSDPGEVVVQELASVVGELLDACLSGDEARLLIVVAGGAGDTVLLERCERIRRAQARARTVLSQVRGAKSAVLLPGPLPQG